MNGISGPGTMMTNFYNVSQMMQNMIQKKDKTKDGAATSSELGGFQSALNNIDQSGNGNLNSTNSANSAAWPTPSLDQRTAHLISIRDKNGDGLLSADEMGISADAFSKIDTNGDGTLDMTELNTAYMAAHAANQYQQAKGSGNSTIPTTSFATAGITA